MKFSIKQFPADLVAFTDLLKKYLVKNFLSKYT